MDMMANKVREYSYEISNMIHEITDVPEGSLCFLCLMIEIMECIWDEISIGIIARGIKAMIWFEKIEGTFMLPAPIAACDKAACYACYHQYIFTVSTWIHGAGCVQIPTCTEKNIRQRFLSDGDFVGFNENHINNKNVEDK